MTTDEMASEEMKNLREKLKNETINDHQLVTNVGAKTEMFKCARCGKRNSMYNQVPTSSYLLPF